MFQKAYRIYCRIEEIIVGLCFLGVVALTFMNAVLRTMKRPITTADDICLLLFAWAALLGADVALRYSRLVSMDMFVTRLPPKSQKALQLLVFAVMIASMLMLTLYGFQLAMRNWSRVLNSLPISYGWVTISLPVSCILMIFTSILKFKGIAINFKDDSYNYKKDVPGFVGKENTGAGLEPKVEKP
jgi:TRAP-type C4-dicarboxylate transport system permease small subunit